MDYTTTLVTEIKLSAAQAVNDLNKMAKSLNAISGNVDSASKSMGGLVGAIKAVGSAWAAAKLSEMVIDVSKRFLEMNKSVADMADAADKLGITTDALQGLNYAAVQGATDAKTLETALGNLNVKIADLGNASTKASQYLNQMGVKQGDNAETALMKIANAFKATSDAATVAGAAAAIFGEDVGRKVIPMLRDGSAGLKQMQDDAKKLGIILDEATVQQAKELDRNLNILKTNLGALGNAILTKVTPTLVEFTKELIANISVLGTWSGTVNMILQQLGKGITISTKAEQDRLLKEMDRWQKIVDQYKGMDNGLANSLRSGAQKQLNAVAAEYDKVTNALKETDEETQRLLARYPVAGQAAANALKPVTTEVKKHGKSAKEAADAFDQWLKSLDKAVEGMAMVPKQTAYLTAELNKLQDAGMKGSGLWNLYFDELKKIAPELAQFVEYIDPVTKALNSLNDEVADFYTEQSNNKAVLAAVEEQMAALALAGQSASKAFEVLAAKRADLQGLLDPVVAVANAIKKDMNKALEDSSNVIEAYGRGLITIEELRRKAGESAGKLAKDTEDLGKAFVDAGKTFTEGFVNEMIDGLGKAELSLSDFLENFVKMIAKTMTNYVVQRFFKTFADMYLAGGSSGGAFAQGAAFYNGIQRFASGGILNSPTFFNTSRGLAVAGEAGPEAVVPLQRTANGDLGVSASPVNIVINNNASEVVAVSASSTDNADGSKQINVFVEHKVKTMFASGQMDRTMSSSYGLTRQPR